MAAAAGKVLNESKDVIEWTSIGRDFDDLFSASFQSGLKAGLPDFSCYNTPKREKYTKNDHKIY
jgi:hypothetical protein